jgi:hypothetical protein
MPLSLVDSATLDTIASYLNEIGEALGRIADALERRADDNPSQFRPDAPALEDQEK